MPRGIGDDEATFGRREEAVGNVDGDALFALGLQSVNQQGEIQPLTLSAKFSGVRPQSFQLILKNQFGVIEQAADQRRLAIIYAAAGDEPQGIHQKYPSCFLRSIELAPSWSMIRPCRSEVVVPRVSATISSSVVALLSIPAVSG